MENNKEVLDFNEFKRDVSPDEDILIVLYENIAADLLNIYGKNMDHIGKKWIQRTRIL